MIILNTTSTNFQLPVEVICTLITLCGTILAAAISWFVSRYSINKEIEKLKLTWEREDVVSSDDEFAAMAAKVAEYISSRRSFTQKEALSKVAAVRSKEHGALANSLDNLYFAIKEDRGDKADHCLTEVIKEKRKAKRNSNADIDKKPSN